MNEITPIQRFLATPDGAESPFDLLALSPDSCDDETLQRALRARLSRIDQHPMGSTHEADEVRLALHAAAAQLADPAVREALARRLRVRRAPLPASVQSNSPAPARTRTLDGAEEAFRTAALPVLVRRRRLGPRDRRLIIVLAHAHGLDVASLRRALTSTAAFEPASAAPAPSNGSHPRPPRPPDPAPPLAAALRRELEREGQKVARRLRHTALTVALAAAVGVIAVVTIFLVVASFGDRRARVAPPEVASSPESPAGAADGAPSGSEAAAKVTDPAEILAALRGSVALLKTDPSEAAWRFERAVADAARAWPAMDGPSLEACLDACVEFLLRAPAGAESSRRALAAIASGAGALIADAPPGAMALAPAAWSSGALSRLSRQEEFIASVRDEIRARLLPVAPTAIGVERGGFPAGAWHGLLLAAERLPFERAVDADGPRAWARWIELADAWRRIAPAFGVAPPDASARRDDLVLRAAERILFQGPSPSESPRSRDALHALLAALDWKLDPSPARRRLLDWFADTALATRDLAVVTEWLTVHSEAPGVTSAMLLPRAATAARRSDIRALYAAAWAGAAPDEAPTVDTARARAGDDDLARAWIRAAASESAEAPSAGPIEGLRSAVVLARLNAAAAHRWRGDNERALEILGNLADPVLGAMRAANAAPGRDAAFLPGVPADGLWARDYITAPQALDGKLELLEALVHRPGPIGPIDAEIAADAALAAPQVEIRTRAAQIVAAHETEAAMVNALLEALPSAPRLEATSLMIERVSRRALPHIGDPAWPAAARAAIVARLIDLLAARTEASAVEPLARALGEAHAAALMTSAEPPPVDPDEAAAARARELLLEAERLPPSAGDSASDIARRRDAALAIARGPVDRFAAHQDTSLRALASIVVADQRSGDAVERILEEAADRIRAAPTVFHQIAARERAMAELWRLRFGDALPEARP